MKKNFKLILALVLSVMMILGSVAALADTSSAHTITINNTDQYVSHSYEAYQVFVGTLDASQTKLADIQWGSGVNGATLLTALKASTVLVGDNPATDTVEDDYNLFTACTTAADVAEILGSFVSTNGEKDSSGMIDEVARIINDTEGVLTSRKATFTEASGGKSYTADVTGDGYYFIKDVTTNLTQATGDNPGSDTKSKHLLAVVKNVSITAKDTHMKPDKEIIDDDQLLVKAASSAVGKTVNFEVKINVPNTKKYVDHFTFAMMDQLPAGLTFTGITGIYVGDLVEDTTEGHNGQMILETTPDWALTTSDYEVYTKTGSGEFAAFTSAPSDPKTATGGQQIKVVFKDFKDKVEGEYTTTENAPDLIGKTVVIRYTAVVNKNADFTILGNENDVYFDYSNDPNHDYNGDEPGPNEPHGQTPHDKTKTLLINLEIKKIADGNTSSALAGAEFEITSTDFVTTLVSGEKYVAIPTGQSTVTAGEGETIEDGIYYQLNDDSFTTTEPTDATASMYKSRTQTYKKVTFSKSVTTPTGTTKTVTVISDKNGQIKLEGLNAGTYTIKETKAPAGYNLDPNTYTIKVDWNKTSKSFMLDTEGDDKSSQGVTFDADTAFASITINNNSGAQLPSTGGIGTTIFYIGGSILVLAAAILLITKRRMSSND